MMLFPEDPKQRPQLWIALKDQLANQSIVVLVSGGTGDPSAFSKKLSSEEVEAAISRMRKASICRISANRSTAVAPHLAGSISDRTVTVTDFITNPSPTSSGVELASLQNDLESGALSLIYGTGRFDSVRVPLHVPAWKAKDLLIRIIPEGIELSKAS